MIAFNHQHRGASGKPGVQPHPGHPGLPPRRREGTRAGQRSHLHPAPEGVHPLGPGKESTGYDSASATTQTVNSEGKVA